MRAPHRRRRGLSAASGFVWFFVFAILVVAILSYKGVGVISYPPEAAEWPVVGQWLNVPENPEDAVDPNAPRTLTQEEVLMGQVNNLTQQLENAQQKSTSLQASLDAKDEDVLKLQADVARLQDLINLQKDSQKAAVAKVYERMDAADAVKIMEGMQPERVAIILGGMKDSASAEILAAMDPAVARTISDILAGFDQPLRSADVVTPEPNPGTIPPVGSVDPPGGINSD